MLPEGITVDKASIQMSMPEAKYTIDEKRRAANSSTRSVSE
ncbi:hypothetical protein ACT7C6_13980 [Bacillus paranthracis]